ncbi:putative retinal pigment epithelial membrane family protein [Phaeomoniella chlamydospora]|uniref:Putative retinal pigment epithelial membrane family protein n=1 Tax=Phaeomoniella chlamydospora TaxID=158046 RepID=A0A0G2F467_PHACM|nr:putative retinal pigment epithelial membrane family protein [Phaeomoniella chlamydospora]
MPMDNPGNVNIGVSLTANFPGLSSTGAKIEHDGMANALVTLCNKSDQSTIQMLDPETLEPIGLAKQKNLHPKLSGPLSGAHAKIDPVTGDVYNYNLDPVGLTSVYRVFSVSAKIGKTTILATLRHPPAYIHSILLTERYVILCV